MRECSEGGGDEERQVRGSDFQPGSYRSGEALEGSGLDLLLHGSRNAAGPTLI